MGALKQVTAMQMRHSLGDLLNEVQYKNSSVIITKASKPVAVLIDIKTFEQLKGSRKEQALLELRSMTSKIRESFKDEPADKLEKSINEAVSKSRKQRKTSK